MSQAEPIKHKWQASRSAFYIAERLDELAAELTLVAEFMESDWKEDHAAKNRLLQTEGFLLHEGYRRVGLDGMWTKEPYVESE